MKAAQVRPPGGIDDLYIGDNVVKPVPKDNQVLLKVYATAINRADTLQRRGAYPPPSGESDILGLEAVGVVESLGSGVKQWKVGDKAMALLSGGGNAQFVCVHEALLMPIPSTLSFTEAAAIPEVWLTAFQLLFFVGNMKDGESVLIHAGGSGVGTAAVQLARRTLSNTTIIVTAGAQEKIDAAKKFGANDGFNYKEGSFVEKVLNATGGKGVDLVLDCVGASFWEQNTACLKVDGRWVVYGGLGGTNINGDLLGRILYKRLSVTGSTLRTRSIEYKARLVGEFTRVALPLFEAKTLVPVIHAVLPLERIRDSHAMMESGDNTGKIVLEVSHDDHQTKSDL